MTQKYQKMVAEHPLTIETIEIHWRGCEGADKDKSADKYVKLTNIKCDVRRISGPILSGLRNLSIIVSLDSIDL
jgi:hypothetical protein